MTTAKGRIHCLQFLQVQVQGMFPHKSAPSSKEKELEGDCNGEPCSLAVVSTRILQRTAVGGLYQQLEPPPRPALCFLLLLPQLRPLRVLAGSSAGSILSSLPRIYPVLPRWNPRAEPLPSPGYRPELPLHHGLEDSGADQDRLLNTLHTVWLCPAAACPLALFLGSWASSLPRLQGSLGPILPADKRRGLKPAGARISSLTPTGHPPQRNPRPPQGFRFRPRCLRVLIRLHCQTGPTPSGSFYTLWLVICRGRGCREA